MTVLRRVGLNLLYLVPGAVGGSETYARRLVEALADARSDVEFIAFAGHEAAPSLVAEGWPQNVRVVRLPVHSRVKPARIAAELALLPVAAHRSRVQLLHSLGTTSPLIAPCPRVVTVLDLIYEHFPDTFPRAARWGLKALVGPGARRSDRVIAISNAAKADVVARLRVRADRVDVGYLGFGMARHPRPTPETELRQRFGLGSGRVILCVSAALVHKNLPRLIHAFAALGGDLSDCRLVIAGHAGREHAALEARATEMGVGERVRLTGWVTDADLEGLYAMASCAAYPSLHEGFGLPVLEAMARAVPLACSDAASLPEVAGDGAELFDPRSTGAMAAAIRRILIDPERAATLVSRGSARVELFTWERAARDVLRTYERVLDGERRRWDDYSSGGRVSTERPPR